MVEALGLERQWGLQPELPRRQESQPEPQLLQGWETPHAEWPQDGGGSWLSQLSMTVSEVHTPDNGTSNRPAPST